MNVIVTGSRDHDNPQLIREALSECLIHQRSRLPNDLFQVIQGGAGGADTHAKQWCSDVTLVHQGVECVTMPADWSKYGPSAGPRRNIEMLTQYPDAIVLAFPQGASKGTRHCIREAEKRGMPVKLYESEKQ